MQRRAIAGLALVLALVLVAALVAGVALGRSRRTAAVAEKPGDQSAPPAAAPTSTTGAAPVPEATTTVVAAPVPQATTSPAPPPASAGAATARPVRYAFPVKPASGAAYGRTHHDYPAADLFTPCGSAVVAPTSGTLTELRATDAWSAGNDTGATRGGLSFTLVGDDGVRYYGSHLQAISGSVAVGARVEAGAEIGVVGRSGNARSTPCHLHFGISPPCSAREWSVRRGTIYPQPFLDSWRRGGSDSPSAAIRRWAADNPSACAAAAALPDAAQS